MLDNIRGVFMSKYTYEEKLEAVLRVLNDEMGVNESARVLGCIPISLRQWIGLYKAHGPDALLNGGCSYSGEFKISVVEYMHSNHLSSVSTAAHFGIKSKASVLKWERIYYEVGPAGLLKTNRHGRPPKSMKKENIKDFSEQTWEDLIAEVQRLRMENEYLKKLNALVQKRIDRENGKEPPSSKN